MRGYQEDLAYIHDVGFSRYSLGAAPSLLRILKRNDVARGLVVDLGCGSGRWARELNRAGYQVLGVDQSPAMIRLARRNAPASRFMLASLWRADLPQCDAITSLGECLNYCFDRPARRRSLARLFKRAYRALRPGGVFICDFAGPDRRPEGGTRTHRSAGRDWSVIASTVARGPAVIRRRIVAFREIGNTFRRSEEVHSLRLYSVAEVAQSLARCGFRVRAISRYGRFRLPRGICGVLAVKPQGSTKPARLRRP